MVSSCRRPAPVPEFDVFEAIANPVRRAVLDALKDGPRPVNEIAGEFQISRPAISQHLRVLKHAGLVTETKVGREHLYELDASPLREVDSWIATYEVFWQKRLKALRELLDEGI